MRTCATCQADWPESEFYTNGTLRDGTPRYKSVCKACHRAKVSARRRTEKGRALRREWYATKGGRERQRDYYERMRSERFFEWRARLWSNRWQVDVAAEDLVKLWDYQAGLCALSGCELGPDAHLDHIVPVAEGGSHTIENLRWVDPAVNVARQAMADEDFVQMCADVVAAQAPVTQWIAGRLLQALEDAG